MKQYNIDAILEANRERMICKHFSMRTISNYNHQVNEFLNSFAKDYRKATVDDLASYIASFTDSRSKMSQVYGALKFFYNYTLKRTMVFPFIPFPKKEQRIPDIPTHEQVLSMIHLTENTKHKLILSMLYGTGIRLEEIISIKWKDIQRTKGLNPLIIKIHGKGNKDRLVPLSDKLNSLLADYCREYKLGCKTNKEEYVLGGALPYSMGSVNKVVKRAGIAAKVPFKVTPHKLRHAYAMYLHHEKKIELIEIGKLLGHSSNSTTMIYARMKPSYIETPI